MGMNNEQTIQIDSRLKLKDYFHASFWFSFNKIFVKLLVGIAIITLLLFLFAILQNPSTVPFGLLVPSVIVLVIVLSIYLNARRGMSSNKSLRENIRYVFSHNGIDAIAESSSGHTSWNNMLKAYETSNAFLLLISHNQFYTIPKRFFRSGEQITRFKEMLRSHLSSRAKLK